MAESISPLQLLLGLLPLAVCLALYIRWELGSKELLTAVARMLVQLLSIGYVLAFLFNTDQWPLMVLTMTVMITAASWISLRSVKTDRKSFIKPAFLSLVFGATPVLLWSITLTIPKGFQANVLIPLAGMTYANAMNSVGIAVERFLSEKRNGTPYRKARNRSLKAALIPHMNMFFAVGLVSIPGLMTGQILAGTDPLIAVRYQMAVIVMIFCSCTITAAIFLLQQRHRYDDL